MARGTRFIALALAGSTLWGGQAAQVAHAQDAAVAPPPVPAAPAAAPAVVTPAAASGVTAIPAENGRLFVEFKSATLFDAVQLVQQAVGRTDYEFADEDMAKATLVPTNTYANAAWDNIIRNLTSVTGFKIVPQPTGKKSIELRAPAFGYGGYGEGGSSGYPGGYPGSSSGYGSSSSGYPGGYPGYGSGSSGYSGSSSSYSGGYSGGSSGYPGSGSSLPANPFAGGRRGRTQQFTNQQTAPGLAGATSNEGKDYRVLRVQHVYVGGIAKLFGDADIISTEDFLLPDSALSGGMMGGMGGGMMGGMGGGMMGGMGGGMMGGMGGMMGGMGGFGGGMGGFGGGMGGFGGGMGGGLMGGIGNGIGF